MEQPVQSQPNAPWSNPTTLDVAFKEYQLLMNGTDSMTDRRQTVNTLFVSINALFLTGVGYLLLQFFQGSKTAWVFIIGFVVIAIIMSVINDTWLKLSESSRRLVDLRIRYMKELEAQMRKSASFPSVIVTLEKDEIGPNGEKTLDSRGTYTLEDVLYNNPKTAQAAFGFSRAEQRIGRTFTTAYWLVVILAALTFLLEVGMSLAGIKLTLP